MHERVLKRLRERVRSRRYVLTIHADEEMEKDGLSVFDVESVILTGRVVERQRDAGTGEWKFVVRGWVLDRVESAEVVVKIGATGKLVILTMYLD